MVERETICAAPTTFSLAAQWDIALVNCTPWFISPRDRLRRFENLAAVPAPGGALTGVANARQPISPLTAADLEK
jgi:hypothetical protein